MAHATNHTILKEIKHHREDVTVAITDKGYLLRWERKAKASARIRRMFTQVHPYGHKTSWVGAGRYAMLGDLTTQEVSTLANLYPGFGQAYRDLA